MCNNNSHVPEETFDIICAHLTSSSYDDEFYDDNNMVCLCNTMRRTQRRYTKDDDNEGAIMQQFFPSSRVGNNRGRIMAFILHHYTRRQMRLLSMGRGGYFYVQTFVFLNL